MILIFNYFLYFKRFFIILMNLDKTDVKNAFSVPNDKNEHFITVANDEEFVIRIRGNATTGYAWLLDKESLDTNFLEPLNYGEYVTDPNPALLCGVGGTYTFKFKAKGKGNGDSAKIKFINKRPWEETPISVNTVNLKFENSNS
jgi:predicted secreted protein